MTSPGLFISWSGSRSKLLAAALRDWLPQVIQQLRPWVSSSDIAQGKRWSSELAQAIEQAQISIICLTPENLSSPWILYETGALSRPIDRTLVCPLLLNLEPDEIEGPIAQFQATRINKGEMHSLMQTINKSMGPLALGEIQLREAFERAWPIFKNRISSIPAKQITAKTEDRRLENMEAAIKDLAAILNSKINAIPALRSSDNNLLEGEASPGAKDSLGDKLIDIADKLIRQSPIDPETMWQLAEILYKIKEERENIRDRIVEIIEAANT